MFYSASRRRVYHPELSIIYGRQALGYTRSLVRQRPAPRQQAPGPGPRGIPAGSNLVPRRPDLLAGPGPVGLGGWGEAQSTREPMRPGPLGFSLALDRSRGLRAEKSRRRDLRGGPVIPKQIVAWHLVY